MLYYYIIIYTNGKNNSVRGLNKYTWTIFLIFSLLLFKNQFIRVAGVPI